MDAIIPKPNMNYSNMIEEKNLKKGFIIATLLSTIVGTFTASMALHEKIKDRMEKNKQKGVDNNQDVQLKELKEKLEKLEKGEGGGGDAKKTDSKSDTRSHASRSRSRSRRGRSRRDSPMEGDEDDFAQSAKRSKDLIEQTYHENVSQLGTKYAQGDLITENALQGEVIQLQQTVIDVLQRAVDSERPLSKHDLRRIANAQEIARDGSVQALNAQRDRLMAANQPPPGRVVEELSPSPSAPPPQSRNTPPIEQPLKPPPPPEKPRQALPPPEPSHQKQWDRRAEPERVSRAKSVHGGEPLKALPAPEPRAMPWERQLELGRSSCKTVYQEPVFAPRSTGSRHGPPRNDSHVPEGPAPSKSQEKYPDPFATAALGVAAGTAAATVAGTKAGRSTGSRDEPPSRKLPSQRGTFDHQRDRRCSVREPLPKEPVPKEPWMPSHDVRRRSIAVQDQAPPKANSDPIRKAASDRGTERLPSQTPHHAPIRSSSVTSPPPPSSSRRSSRGSPPPGPKTIKALPAPAPSLFCRYSKDLQKDHMKPLDKAFGRSGDHRCPTCRVDIPVETRDVWVLSTHFPGNTNNDSAMPRARDYRMDARFVVKCHTADGRGHFACILCDKLRDIDCICRDVDALVKHLGMAHSPDEFDGDPDLVRMKDGSIVNGKSGREIPLA